MSDAETIELEGCVIPARLMVLMVRGTATFDAIAKSRNRKSDAYVGDGAEAGAVEIGCSVGRNATP